MPFSSTLPCALSTSALAKSDVLGVRELLAAFAAFAASARTPVASGLITDQRSRRAAAPRRTGPLNALALAAHSTGPPASYPVMQHNQPAQSVQFHTATVFGASLRTRSVLCCYEAHYCSDASSGGMGKLPQELSAVRPPPLSTHADCHHHRWDCDARSSRAAISTNDPQSQNAHTAVYQVTQQRQCCQPRTC